MYPRISKRRWRQIDAEIRHLLLTKWDPIGVSDIPEARDEYDSYAFGVYKLLVSRASEQDIVDYLYKIERNFMGIAVHEREALSPVALALLRVNVSP